MQNQPVLTSHFSPLRLCIINGQGGQKVTILPGPPVDSPYNKRQWREVNLQRIGNTFLVIGDEEAAKAA